MPDAPRRVCFMIMPFGRKTTGIEDGGHPARLDFDELWEKALQPAIADMGYAPIRADHDLGALIIQEMLERLTLADLVIADLTIPNGNVYYEVGVRHAARKAGCVLIAAEWARPLFDLKQMRQVRYPLSSEVVSDAEAGRIRKMLAQNVPPMADSTTPLHALPGYPDLDPARTMAFKELVDELSAFQQHVRAARHAPKKERPQRVADLVARVTGDDTHGPMMAAVAVDLINLIRDYRGWEELIAFIAILPKDIRDLPNVQEQLCLARSKSGDPPVAIGALEELIRLSGDSSERQGLLGGRYKKLYSQAQDPADKKRYLRKAIAHYENGMYLDLNDYFPSCNLPRLYRLRGRRGDSERAQAVANVVVAACERARRLGTADEWLHPTLLGAAFDAADVTTARELLDQVADDGPAAWKIDTTINDLRASAALCSDDDTRDELEEMIGELAELL